MRLKEIKPGMVIHCKNDEEKKALLEEAERLGYMWANGYKPTEFSFPSNSLVFREDGLSKRITWSVDGNKNTEFSDLILPELTADEVLDILSEIRNCKDRDCYECPLDSLCGDNGGICVSDKKKILQICQQWKAEHKKKEPEVEWVYRVFGAENFGEKFFNTEEEAIKRCEELAKSQKTKQYARYERVCRVKAVE